MALYHPRRLHRHDIRPRRSHLFDYQHRNDTRGGYHRRTGTLPVEWLGK